MATTATDDLGPALWWTALFDALGAVAIVLLAFGIWIIDHVFLATVGVVLDDPSLEPTTSYVPETAFGLIACVSTSLVVLATLPRMRPSLNGCLSALAGTVVGACTFLLTAGINPVTFLLG
jgi:hypothetical protein